MADFYDYASGVMCTSISDDIAIDYYGNHMKRISRNMAIDMESGDLHAITSWDSDDN